MNVIILIPIRNLLKTKAYRSLKKLCEENDFPKYELYRRDKYQYPFFKVINGVNYLFIKFKIK